MLKHYWKVLSRNLIKNPVYSAINITGFTIGITCSLLIYLWVIDEITFEESHPDAKRISRVLTLKKEGNDIVKTPITAMPLAKALKDDFPQIENATFILYESSMPVKWKGKKFEVIPGYTDDNFFDVFSGFEFIEGNKETAFKTTGSVVISEEMAAKLFGKESALGNILESEKIDKQILMVSGVVRIPRKSHIDFDVLQLATHNGYLINYHYEWQSSSPLCTYVQIHPNAKFDQASKNHLANYLKEHIPTSDKLLFQPITDIHLHTDYEFFRDQNLGSPRYVLAYSVLAFLVLIIAALNFMTLTTARATQRAKEVAVKKVCGSVKRQLILQYSLESIIQTFIALMLGLILLQVFLPWFNALTNKDILLKIDIPLVLSILALCLLAGIISGLYPAFYLSAISPLRAFRKGTQTGSKAGFFKILVTFQFIISIGLIICTGYIHKQLLYIRNKDLGFNKENIIIIPTGLWYGVNDYKQEILNNPNVINASASMSSPVDFFWTNHDVSWEGKQTSDTVAMTEVFVDEDFADTYGLEIIKGDFIQTEFAEYWRVGEDSLENKSAFSFPTVINETAWNTLGFDDPIGKRINNKYLIVGIVKDFHFKPLQEKVMPLFMSYNPEACFCVNIKIRPENMSQTIAYIQETYEKFRPERGFSYGFFEDELAEKYETEQRQGTIFLYFTILSILISSLGVLGLAIFSADWRTKEIGVRKVFGGSLSRILILLISDFSKWIIIAFALVCPLAWYIIQQWAQSFVYRTEISWWIFVLSGLLVYLVAILTTVWVSFRAAARNPVESLRNE